MKEEIVYKTADGNERVGGEMKSYGIHIHEWEPKQEHGWRELPDGTREPVYWDYGLGWWMRNSATDKRI